MILSKIVFHFLKLTTRRLRVVAIPKGNELVFQASIIFRCYDVSFKGGIYVSIFFTPTHLSKTFAPKLLGGTLSVIFSQRPRGFVGFENLCVLYWLADFSENLSIRVMKHFSDILCHLSICPLSSVG